MRKPGKGAIHRCRHEGDGIGREGRVRKVFHAPGSAEFHGAIVAQLLHQFDQAWRQACRLTVQIGPNPFTNFLADCRLMDAADLIAIFVRGISHEISNSRQRNEVRNPQRRAVTRRASRIFGPSPAVHKQDAAMSGQTCVAQVSEGARTCRRSPFASAAASLASTLGARAGKAITAVPRSMTTARAEKDLNIVGVLTLVGLNPTAFGDSHHQQPKRTMVPFYTTFVCECTPECTPHDFGRCIRRKRNKGRGFLHGLSADDPHLAAILISVAVGANTHAHAGSIGCRCRRHVPHSRGAG